jgi:hypothetical protein
MRGGKRRCCTLNLDLDPRWGAELQRFKNEEGRQEKGDKGHARMIPRKRGRGVGMRGGVASCPIVRRCPEELWEGLVALVYSHLSFAIHQKLTHRGNRTKWNMNWIRMIPITLLILYGPGLEQTFILFSKSDALKLNYRMEYRLFKENVTINKKWASGGICLPKMECMPHI